VLNLPSLTDELHQGESSHDITRKLQLT
jgi:hypothetical protein